MKAQVTLFVVLGIILMIIVGFSLLIKDMILDNKISESADSIFRELEQASNLNAHMKLCLKDISRNGLFLLGVQGGYIYESQGGTQIEPENVVSNTQRNFLGIEEDYSLSPWIFSEANGDSFSTSNPPKLCSSDGPNRIGVSGLSINSCKLLTVFAPEPYNIQDSFSSYISNSLPDCLNIEEYATRNGNKIVPGTPKTEIVLDENSFLVRVSYPFEISIKGKENSFIMNNYSYEVENRLQTMYNILYLAANQEARDIDFNLEEEILESSFFRDGFVIQYEKDYFDGAHLVWLKDEKSLLNGRPYEFMFAIEDRDSVNNIDPDD